MKIIPYGSQFIDNQDSKLVKISLKEKLITTGKFVERFEKNLKFFFKSKYALTCASGTAALHLSFKSINLKENDVVVMPAINFVAAYNLCLSMKAKVYLADVDKYSGQMTPDSLKYCIKKNKLKNIKLIITMYLGGQPNYIEEFYKIKKKYKSTLIEDACHALGASYKVKNKSYKIGSCRHSDISIFSLHPLKTITTGEGGIISTNNKKIFERTKYFRSHGIVRHPNDHWKYDIYDVGLNYRLSDINSALGITQLKKINLFIKKRKKIFDVYSKNFEEISQYINTNNSHNISYSSAFHLFIISINFYKLKMDKDKFMRYLKSKGIISQFHYIPLYRFLKLSKKYGYRFNIKNFSNSEYYFKSSFSLPIYVNLPLNKQTYIIKTIKDYIFKNVKRNF